MAPDLDYELIHNKFKTYVNLWLKKVATKIPNSKSNLNRTQLIEQKYQHSLRVVASLVKMATQLNLNPSFQEMSVVTGLLHDIGRFKQAFKYGSYADDLCYSNSRNHGDVGFDVLTKEHGFEYLGVAPLYRPSIGIGVKFHCRNNLPSNFNYLGTPELIASNPVPFLTGNYYFNLQERKIISILLQMVRDADKLDILYQRAIGEIEPIKRTMKVKNDGLDRVAQRWGLSPSQIEALNPPDRIKTVGAILQIPVSAIPLTKLKVATEIKNKIYCNESLQLTDLQQRSDFSFITALWWTIYTFVTDLNFTTNLKSLSESKILDQIYHNYPPQYQSLIKEIFDYCQKVLIPTTLDSNQNQLYLRTRQNH